MQSNGDRRKEYAALEKTHVAVEKEIQKHPHQRREDREGVRRRREGDPEAPAPRIPWQQGTHQERRRDETASREGGREGVRRRREDIQTP